MGESGGGQGAHDMILNVLKVSDACIILFFLFLD
jgi:hypothetical protein